MVANMYVSVLYVAWCNFQCKFVVNMYVSVLYVAWCNFQCKFESLFFQYLAYCVCV